MEVDQEFKDAVKAYIDMHDRLADASKQLRDIRKKKKELSEVIVEYMRKNEIDGINIKDGKLLRKTSKRLEPLKKEHILSELSKSVGETQAENILVGIFSNRAVTNTDTLRRTKKRGGGNDE
jgi:hypothetical protein